MKSMIYGLALMLTAVIGTQAQSPKGIGVPVTAENFIRAESDTYFAVFVNRGGFGKFIHLRELEAADLRTAIRPNRDTLYSFSVFDLDAGPVTISLPEAGNRYMSLQVIDQDHFSQACRIRRRQLHLPWGKGLFAVHRRPCAHSR